MKNQTEEKIARCFYLSKTDKNTNTKPKNKSDNNLLLYLGIGTAGLVVIGLVILVIYKSKRK